MIILLFKFYANIGICVCVYAYAMKFNAIFFSFTLKQGLSLRDACNKVQLYLENFLEGYVQMKNLNDVS